VGTFYSDARSQIFERIIRQAGFPCFVYQPPRASRRLLRPEREQQGWLYEEDVAHWLQTLPRPVGLMACNDTRGQQVLNACREVGIAVPDAVAVVGVDNDELVCELCDPPLSSVVPNTRQIGYEAAALLDRLLRGEKPPRQLVWIPPLGIVTRRSTDILAIEDRDIAAAVRFIRDNACNGITVAEVVRRLPLSHATLERQFHRYIGRTPKAEIIRVQLERVKQLLAETNLSLKEIASQTGFTHTEYLSALFKSKTGQTPGQCRKSVRRHPGAGVADGHPLGERSLFIGH
jgi:LacI family transcriptional regulator